MKKQKKTQISGEMAISEAISRWPETIPVFMKHGLHCIGCPMAMSETIEQAAEGHGINASELIKELNKKAKKKNVLENQRISAHHKPADLR